MIYDNSNRELDSSRRMLSTVPRRGGYRVGRIFKESVMLFRLASDLTSIKPLPFSDLGCLQGREKDLERLLSNHLFDLLFESNRLLPFHQERAFQPEGDIYAVDEQGNIVIFELKLSTAFDDALYQLLRYAQQAAKWSYDDIDDKFKRYQASRLPSVCAQLNDAHCSAFNLTAKLKPEEFNRRQHLVVIGSAADRCLIQAVDYWRATGVSIDYCPYRIYHIGDEYYFEFFSKPYDEHINPAEKKGVLFDTCGTYYPGAFEWMMNNRRVSAFDDRKDAVDSLKRGDFVFYYHVGLGVVAAGTVIGNQPKTDKSFPGGAQLERYWDVEIQTPLPTDYSSPKSMPIRDVEQLTGKRFFLARIQKVPYLSPDEADTLVKALKPVLAP